jgi:diguanylate cyclase (GGDEF)-like protein
MDLVNDYTKEQYQSYFFKILKKENISTAFQPILSLRDASVLGYEALCRGPKETVFESPSLLFDLALETDKIWELETLCRSKALNSIGLLSVDALLFLNVNPNIMHNPGFKQGFTKDYLDKVGIDPHRIVFEITEREAIKNISIFKSTINNYKMQDFKIAIDDAGAGYSGLNLISDINPHFIKLDMNLIRDVDKDMTKQSLLRSMVEFSNLTNTKLIAEGIETEEELETLVEIGINYGQGYYLQRPDFSFQPIKENIKDTIHRFNRKKNHFNYNKLTNIYIENITQEKKAIHPKILVSQVYEMMTKDLCIPGYCVVNDGTMLGVITRNEIMKYMSGQFGYSLYAKKTISDIMNRDFISVEYDTTIDIVAKKSMQRQPQYIYDFVTVTKEGKYFGIVTVKNLLEKSIEIEVMNAKHLNPLSELPGNMLIEKQLEQVIHNNDNQTVMYFDIDNFKAYNDVYGFENGDRILRNLTQILKKRINNKNFIGHIGGDDFMAIVNKNLVKEICVQIIDDFDKSMPEFYSYTDFNKGYIQSKNRFGIEELFPIASISIACLDIVKFDNIFDLAEHAGKMKKELKKRAGSNFHIE